MQARMGPDEIDPLNARERDILLLISEGLSNQEIALRLHLSLETIKWYNKQLFAKLGVSSRGQAVARAQATGLFENRETASSARTAQHNLPAALTSFVGREQEIAEIRQLLAANRLLVLTGPGGSGKTRLALETARQVITSYPDGVWWLELSSLTHPVQVVHALAALFGIKSGREDLQPVLRRYLSHRRLLLVLDNFEHLLPAAPLLGELLSAAEGVAMLVTSRERLHIYGECEYPVQPLRLPGHEGRQSLEGILICEAVQLFAQRAQAVLPGFSLRERDAVAAAEICQRLDGLPLALELAASRIRLYTLPQLADQLKESLALLSGGPRDLPARQQTLRSTVEWSYSLLSAEEKILFARLAVFRAGGTLEAVEAVCPDEASVGIRVILAALVDKNLVIPREQEDGEIHFDMLETIHHYALECMETSGESESLRQKHADYFTKLAERADQELLEEKQEYGFIRLRAERENTRAALEWLSSQPDSEAFLRMVASLGQFWYFDGRYMEESRQWVGLALQKASAAPISLAARINISAAFVALQCGDLLRARTYFQAAYDEYCQMGDENRAAMAESGLGYSYCRTRDDALLGIPISLRLLDYFRRMDNQNAVSEVLNILGELYRMAGDYEQAKYYYEGSLRLSEKMSVRHAHQYLNLMQVAYYQSDPALMEKYARKALSLYEEMNLRPNIPIVLCLYAGLAVLHGKPKRAVRIQAATRTMLDEVGALPLLPVEQATLDHILQTAKDALGEAAFQAAWEEGAAMSYAEAIACAFETAG